MIPDFLEIEKFLPSVGYLVIQATCAPLDVSDIHNKKQKNNRCERIKITKSHRPSKLYGPIYITRSSDKYNNKNHQHGSHQNFSLGFC
jgi:hypothetical protein